eukprot:7279150-Pyramimonas_sp.AAC.1
MYLAWGPIVRDEGAYIDEEKYPDPSTGGGSASLLPRAERLGSPGGRHPRGHLHDAGQESVIRKPPPRARYRRVAISTR